MADVEVEDAGPPQGKDVKAPFPVATIKDNNINLRAYFNQQGNAEWLWPRIQDALGIGGYGGSFLQTNKAAVAADMALLEVPGEQMHYKPKGYEGSPAEPWKDHTLEGRAMLSLLVTCLKSKPLKAEQKEKALKMFVSLASIANNKAHELGQVPAFPPVTICAPDGSLKVGHINVNKHGLCGGWAAMVNHIPAAQKLWNKLEESAGGQTLWESLGKGVLPNLMIYVAAGLEAYAVSLTYMPLQELPVLKSKRGFTRKSSDQVNKLLVLDRVKNERLHRWRVARTHANLISEHCKLMKQEAYLTTVLHERACSGAFQGVTQISVVWDPSSYGGMETFVGMIYSVDLDLAAYMLVQPLRRLLVGDLSQELKADGKKGRLTRVEGYVELRALSNSMKSMGLTLPDFNVPLGLHLEPLKPNEIRAQKDGLWYIVDTKEGIARPQIPTGMLLGKLPVLVSISDQGPSNMAALNYIQFSKEAILCCCLYDPFHRAWNDIKLAARRARCYPYKTMLEMTVVYNLPYGPFGSGTWFGRKHDCLQDFLAQHSASSTTFQEHLPYICRELGELYATKMILMSAGTEYEAEQEEPAASFDHEGLASKDPRAELAELKKKKGVWKLAQLLITERNIDLQRMVMQVCRATWKHHALRARTIKSPSDVFQYNVACSTQWKWAEELEDMVRHGCFDREELFQQFHEEPGEDRKGLLAEHANFLEELLCVRGSSLAVAALTPPMRYCGTLSPDPAEAAKAIQQVQKEWRVLLEVESAVAAGGTVPFLDSLVWRKSPFVRALFLAYEQGLEQGCALQMHLAKNLGDSRVVETAHSKCKDILRESKSNAPSLTAIQHQLLLSKSLEERNVNSITVNPADKVFASSSAFTSPVLLKMNPRSHKLPVSLQKMMAKQGVTNSWPSPSPASMFPIQAATEWLFSAWDAGLPAGSLEKAWVTLLAGKPGTIVAQKSTGVLVKVLQAAEYGLLGWLLDVQKGHHGKAMYFMNSTRASLGWYHIFDLNDWVVVPCEPQLLNPGVGPMGWVRVGNPVTLPMAVCKEGAHITVKQIKHLLQELGVAFAKNLKKRQLQILLIERCLTDAEEQQKAIAKIPEVPEAQAAEADLDDEVLDALEEDEANFQEIKKIRKEVGKKKQKKEKAEEPVQSNKKPKAKAGKGKGSAQVEGVPKVDYAKVKPKPAPKQAPEAQPKAEPRMKQKTQSSYFGGKASWKDCLASVHEFNWRKWHVMRDKLPLEPGQPEQVPGKIPLEIYQWKIDDGSL
ncbi:unnamed protein product, partial [Cladocopium goreaui]